MVAGILIPLEERMAVGGYASTTSVRQAENISFHINDDASSLVQIEVVDSATEDTRLIVHAPASRHVPPENAYELGCGWPILCTITIPTDWPSGLYYARVSNGESPPASSKIYFVVKAANPGRTSRILLQLATTTYQAYNSWGGKSLYPSASPNRARKVSFNRPGGVDYARELAFLFWMRQNRLPVECCTSIDLHEDESMLSNYKLLISVGHDEYWSKEMRDNVEQFIGNGGNVAFFSGNVCWWQIRFEDNNRTMVCYRNAMEDPLTGVDNGRVTVNWYNAPVSRPENYLTGVSFRYGAGIWQPCQSSMDVKGFRVLESAHWVFEGTGLCNGDWFGLGEKIVGYETDAANYYVDANGSLRLTGDDGTPPSFVVLATADLTDWGRCGKAGYATMGVYRRTGTVFTAATTDWVRGLFSPRGEISQITLNVINRLKHPYPGSRWEVIGDAMDIRTMCAREEKLFAMRAGGLCWREPVAQARKWEAIGGFVDVVAMAAGDNPRSRLGQELYAVTRDGQLLRRDPVTDDARWEYVGEATDVVGFAASNGCLFAITQNNRFWWRKVDINMPWEYLGCVDDLDDIVAMTSLTDLLFVATGKGKLLWREGVDVSPNGGNVPWKCVGDVPCKTVTMAALAGKLFAVTDDGRLWWRDAIAG
jgi:hypothetical protein